jgi:hypothetical protein
MWSRRLKVLALHALSQVALCFAEKFNITSSQNDERIFKLETFSNMIGEFVAASTIRSLAPHL